MGANCIGVYCRRNYIISVRRIRMEQLISRISFISLSSIDQYLFAEQQLVVRVMAHARCDSC
jgi:hypothetical protein